MSHQSVVDQLLANHGTTYAAAAGIRLKNTPSPLFQLLVLTMLSSTRISADIAVKAAGELFSAGWRTPQRLRESTWQQRVDALGRGGYNATDDLVKTVSLFPRIGPTGARIFCREVQDVWPEVRPYFDDRALQAAKRLRLPTDPARLAGLAPKGHVAVLAAALVRMDLER